MVLSVRRALPGHAPGGRVRGRIDRLVVPRPTPIPGDLGDWIETLAGSFLAVAPETRRDAVISDVRDAVRDSLQRPDGGWTVDYVRLRFAARLA